MWEAVRSAFAALKDIPWAKAASFTKFLGRRQPVALVVAALLLLISLALAAVYWQRSQTYEEIVRRTIEVKSVPTPQQYKGIDAFVMSNVPQEIDVALQKEMLNPAFVTRLAALQARMSEFAAGGRPENVPLRIIKDQQGREVITNSNSTPGDGFLFLPAQLLRTQPGAIAGVQPPKTADDRLASDLEIRRDVEFVEFIAPQLRALIGTTIIVNNEATKASADVSNYLGLTAKQVYVITKTGVLRIFNSADRPSIYEYQFQATTFFPSRPYFWPTFSEGQVTGNLQSRPQPGAVKTFFSVSKPYMDLGGNGIVMTLSRGFETPNIPLSAVCLDLAFLPQRSLTKTLKDRVERLEGETVLVRCEVLESRTVTCAAEELTGSEGEQSHKTELTIEMQHFFQQKVENDQRSDVFGSIQRINNSTANALHISVPIEETANMQTQVGRFLVFSLDLLRYRHKTTWIAVAASTTFGVMTLFLAYLWGSLARRQSEYEEAFRRVADVMVYSPVPYVRLDAEDKILDVNVSFADLIGYNADVLHGRTFSELVSAESRGKYDDVQLQRRAGEHVDPYPLTLQTSTGGYVHVTAVGAAVPAGEPGNLPQTFGILLKEKPQFGVKLPMISSKK